MSIGVFSACLCTTCIPDDSGDLKMVLDPLELELQMDGSLHVCQEMNLGTLKEQPVLLTTEASF